MNFFSLETGDCVESKHFYNLIIAGPFLAFGDRVIRTISLDKISRELSFGHIWYKGFFHWDAKIAPLPYELEALVNKLCKKVEGNIEGGSK